MTGLTSITFRQLSPDQLLSLTAKAGLAGIEWGGDVHLPPGELGTAVLLQKKTESAGISVLSYGSYYRLCQGQEFLPVLKTAVALGAPNIRIWAGAKPPALVDESERAQAAAELKALCLAAGREGISISLEYHRGTLTETAESAVSLLGEVGAQNLFTYWQPNPELSHENNCRELSRILPWLSKLHVFCWRSDGERRPLREGRSAWGEYLEIAKGRKRDCLLEFVRNDSEAQLLEDAAELRHWMED